MVLRYFRLRQTRSLELLGPSLFLAMKASGCLNRKTPLAPRIPVNTDPTMAYRPGVTTNDPLDPKSDKPSSTTNDPVWDEIEIPDVKRES